MRRMAGAICLVALICAGCASTRSREGTLYERYSGSKQLDQAETLLRAGDTSGATRVLESISNGPAVQGVTDVALFRLALLTLKAKPSSPQAQQLLKRLRKEYPRSEWTVLAAPVGDLVQAVEDQKRQNRNLKQNNQNLAREISDLNQRLEQLKSLDQELEKKAR